MSLKVIAVFDIGKTNKKLLLFDSQLKVVYQNEEKFKTTIDEDGMECDDIELIEEWIHSSLKFIVAHNAYELLGVNFSTYGASLAFLDKDGKRLTPIYNYLKEISSSIQNKLFDRYGGEAEFCRQTASPALGVLLNSGIQILWLKQHRPEIYKNVASIVHFPQYLSYLLTGKIISESTSIGCHTYMWDFDNHQYHQWLSDEGITLPESQPNSVIFKITVAGRELAAGIGIHDSSAALVPYIKVSKTPFLLLSTGTWCINMNPFNHTHLTAEQLKRDCLSYLSIDDQPVKSSRLFMGHIHDVNTDRLTKFFKVAGDSYRSVKTNRSFIKRYLFDDSRDRLFFKGEMPADYVDSSVDLTQFAGFEEAYHRLIYDLTLLNAESIDLISIHNDGVKKFYVSGGFARNEIFVRMLATLYPDKEVFTSEIDNASALGAALVIWDVMSLGELPSIDLGLKKWEGF